MIVLVCGSRDWLDEVVIYKYIKSLPVGSEVIQGGARGADLLARDAAHKLQIPYHTYPAQWSRHGRAAGPIRNRQQFDRHAHELDAVTAFHADIYSSKGTKDMVNYALGKGVPCSLWDGKRLHDITDVIP